MSRFLITVLLMVIMFIWVSACCKSPASATDTQTLYRNSILDPSMRIHVATFDSAEGGEFNPDYNRAACSETAKLYQENDSAQKDWWCEKGSFRP